MRYPYLFILLLTALCFFCCGNASKNPTEEFDNDMPVDLSEVIKEYELYQRCNADEQDSILFSFVDEKMCEGEVSLFEDTSFVIRLPEYKHSKNSYLASAEEFYNNCSFAWNIWSNFEVWYRGETSGELRSAKEIIKSIKDIDVNIINDSDLNKAAQIYKDSILILMSIGIDKWDDAHNPWNVRDSYSDAIAKKACHYYDDRDEFLNKYNIIVETAEGMGKARFQHYLNTNETKQLSVILTELNTCKNFDEQCSLWKLWANTKKSQSEDGWLVAVGKLLMESGKYNPNLIRIWITWRSVCQLYYCGASKDSVIPNPFFNIYRRRCYLTCLKRIEKHPDDIFAMNCAASLAGNPNIIRIGEFSFGNDAVIDASQMMPERFNFDDPNSDDSEEE